MLLDFKNYSSRIFGRYIKLQSTMSGHYSLPLTNTSLEVKKLANIVLHCEALKMFKNREKKEGREITFAHASKEKLISLVSGSKIFNDKEFLDLIQDVCDSCSVCP